MNKYDKVIKGLECCTSNNGIDDKECRSCSYYGKDTLATCWVPLNRDALALLKEYQNIIYCKECQFAQMTPVSYPQYWCVKKNNYMDEHHFCTDGKQKNEPVKGNQGKEK